ncbi:MAG: hypothetical protein AAF378_01730 [Cyanobacteria bacterium P01_A01_bin.84]
MNGDRGDDTVSGGNGNDSVFGGADTFILAGKITNSSEVVFTTMAILLIALEQIITP